MLFPLVIGGACIITSIIGTFFVRLGASNNIMGAMYKGLIATGVLSVAALYPITLYVLPYGMGELGKVGDLSITGMNLFWCGVIGMAVSAAIVWITEYYTGTGYRP